jgi:hypothetical protein
MTLFRKTFFRTTGPGRSRLLLVLECLLTGLLAAGVLFLLYLVLG